MSCRARVASPLCVFGAALLVSSVASATLADTGGGTAVFDAVGPAGLKIEGKTSDVHVAEAGGNVTVTVVLASLKTGIDLRDRHMREKYLEVGKFPDTVFTIARSALQFPADGADATGAAAGTLSLHGQSRPATVNYKAHRTGTAYAVTGTMHLNMTDFGIQQPGYLGVTVRPAVDVTVSFNAQDN